MPLVPSFVVRETTETANRRFGLKPVAQIPPFVFLLVIQIHPFGGLVATPTSTIVPTITRLFVIITVPLVHLISAARLRKGDGPYMVDQGGEVLHLCNLSEQGRLLFH